MSSSQGDNMDTYTEMYNFMRDHPNYHKSYGKTENEEFRDFVHYKSKSYVSPESNPFAYAEKERKECVESSKEKEDIKSLEEKVDKLTKLVEKLVH